MRAYNDLVTHRGIQLIVLIILNRINQILMVFDTSNTVNLNIFYFCVVQKEIYRFIMIIPGKIS